MRNPPGRVQPHQPVASLATAAAIERAKRDPEVSFTALAHLIDEAALARAFGRLRKDAAVGVDGITKEQYGKELDHNLRDLHQRMREGRYRHQPIRRVHIPKDKGKTRPIGISSIEDKIVQSAITEVLSAVYEPSFSNDSYGFRPGRSAHDALRALDSALLSGVSWLLEADIESFFDSIDRKMLREMLRQRVAEPDGGNLLVRIWRGPPERKLRGLLDYGESSTEWGGISFALVAATLFTPSPARADVVPTPPIIRA